MRKRNRTEPPDVAIAQMKVTSLPLKVSTATQTNECHFMTDGCRASSQECYDLTSQSPVEFPGIHSSTLDRTSSSSCSCPECLLSLPTSDLGLEDAADCDLFVFEDDFERLSEAEYQMNDGVGDADQFIDLCFEETSRYLDEISGSKDRHLGLCLELPPLFSPNATGKIASGKNRQDSVDMALIDTGSNHNDSGIGPTTDESVKADDSSEQEMLENYFQPYRFHHSCDGNLSSAALGDFPLETTMLLRDVDAGRKSTSNFCSDLAELNRDFEQMHVQRLATTKAQPHQGRNAILAQGENQQGGTFFPPPKQRIVPRMGTRRDFYRLQNHGVTAVMPQEPFPLPFPESCRNKDEVIWVRNTGVQNNPETNNLTKMTTTYQLPSVRTSDDFRDSDRSDLTSAYNTGNSCCSTPILPQKVITPSASEQKHPLPDGQPLSTAPGKMRTSEVNQGAIPNSTNMASQTVDCKPILEAVPSACHLKSLQKLYTQYVDVMYTNHANLEHTIMVQQKLFSQQVQLNLRKRDNDTELKSSVAHHIPVASSNERRCSEDHTPMEWVVKRRSDGSRYIARRPLRNQILKDRAHRLAQERSGITTDDDAASEMKLGRYWSRDKRKVHLEKARSHRQQKELLQRQKMETVRENDDQPNIIELSRRKAMRHKSKKLFDGFTTVQELLAHGNEPFGRSSNPLLSVTTV